LQPEIIGMKKIFQSELTHDQLNGLFQDDEKCLEFLAGLKWAEGFFCRKCGNTNWCAGKTPHSRRCTRCKAEESAATGTIFHNCKFPLSKAFYIAFNVCKGKEEVSTYEFARRLSLRQMTCWKFKTRIQEAMTKMDSLTDREKTVMEKLLAG
jgi:two-component system, sensor histidine kinase LadS